MTKKKRGFYQCASCDRKGKTKDDMELCYYHNHEVLWYPNNYDQVYPLNNLIQIENADYIGKQIKPRIQIHISSAQNPIN